MSGIKLIGDEAPRKLQELARHQIITKLYADILVDMQVCEIEGWDKMEFIRQLQTAINSLGRKAET
jgi:hypothetical protein